VGSFVVWRLLAGHEPNEAHQQCHGRSRSTRADPEGHRRRLAENYGTGASDKSDHSCSGEDRRNPLEPSYDRLGT
jgi:hypothetical protein